MEAEEYFTEKTLSLFAVNYKKYPVLWCSWHPKYADASDRSRAYRRLAVAQGLPGGAGVTRRLEQLCQHFHRRVKQEVARLAAAEAGGQYPEAPRWAVAAEKYLCLKVFARQPTPERRLLRLARGMRRSALAGPGLSTRAAAGLAPRLGLPAAGAAQLWRDLRHEALDAVHKHILRGDVPGPCTPSALQWAVADLIVLYGGEVIADEHYQKVETLQALLGTFHLVQQYLLEPGARGSAAAWTRAARIYSRKGAAASALLLQRRWFELRRSTRARLAPAGPPALPLHRAVADRYPAVVSGELMSWEQMRREGRLARPTRVSGPAPGETFCLGFEDAESDDSVSDKEDLNDDDVILIEREIETIDVDGDDSPDDGAVARARTGHDRDQPTTVNKYFNKGKTPVEETVRAKQADRTVAGASELQDNGNSKDTGETAAAEKGNEKTVDLKERTDTTIGDCALTIANIINQAAACSKTNITDSGSKYVDAAVNTFKKVHDNVEVSIGTTKQRTVSKYSDKKIDDSKENVELDKTIDHNLLEALQDLDADFVETLILFESDEDDAKVKADEQTSDNGVTETVHECLETSSSAGQIEKESKIVHKVSRLSGPKSKTVQLRNRIQFESDEEGVNANDASESGRLDGDDDASDSRVNNVDQNTNYTESSKINRICSKNLDSQKYQNLSERRPSVINRKRRLSDSSESDEGLLVIADSADDISDSSKDRTEVSHENEEVDVGRGSDADTAKRGSPSVVQYPLLVELLKSKSDDLKRYKRFEEIKRRVKMEAKKLLKHRCEEKELDSIATKVVRDSLAQSSSRIQKYARDIVTELNEGGVSDDADEPVFDEKLLMIPVVALARLALPKPPGPAGLLARARTRRLLARCRPCGVRLERCDRGARRRVRLPDIHAVRALNRTIATAQVAPISAAPEAAQAAAGAGAAAGTGADTGASAGTSVARSCVHSDSEFAAGCGGCAARALARPAASRAAAGLQRRVLRRTARLARYQQLLADRQQGKKPRKAVQRSPAPPPRARSPYDAQRALAAWLREKSVGAEKFGIKPRSYKKPAQPVVTMNKAGELNPPLLLNNCSQPTQTVAAHYVVDREGAVRSADAGRRHIRTAFTLNPVTQGFSPNQPTTQIVVTQTSSGQPAAKMTPTFFKVDCIANINKTLNTLATHEQPAPEAEESLLPIITHVESLAVNNQNSPPTPLTLTGQTTITPIPRPTSQNTAHQGPSGNTQCNVSFANSSQGIVTLSGGFLTTQGGYIIQKPQSEVLSQLSTVIQTQNTATSQPVIYNTVPIGRDASQVVLVPSQPAPATQPGTIFQRQANVQVNSVQAGPPQTNSLVLAPHSGQGQLTMTLVNRPLAKPNTLQVTAVHAGLPKTNSLVSPKQMSMLPSEKRNAVQLIANLQANGAPSCSVQTTPSQTSTVLISGASDLNEGPRKLDYVELDPATPACAARSWAAWREPAALCVLGAARAAWRLGAHLVLRDAAAPRAADRYYSLAPLRRLILPEDEDKMKLNNKKQKTKKTKESAQPDQGKDTSMSWLKVKSFAKMGNDAAQGGEPGDAAGAEDTDSAEEAELRAPPCVFLDNKVYAKMSDTPLIYAKVLHAVSGPAACRALLLRRAPVYLYSLRADTLTPVYGEPSADGSSLTLTAAKELFGALQGLAAFLAPPATAPAPTETPGTLCGGVKDSRYGKLLQYMAYTPDKTGGLKKLIKDNSKSRGTIEPTVIHLDSSEED